MLEGLEGFILEGLEGLMLREAGDGLHGTCGGPIQPHG